ncbi:MAG: PAS domain S-box protein [Lentimicrobiaceae bacterium]|jgi:hypothetical protein
MNNLDKTNDELIKEIQELQQENNFLKASYNNRITGRKAAETGLKKNRTKRVGIIKAGEEVDEFAENIINTLREPLLVLDQDLRVVKASRSFYSFFKVTAGETVGKLIYDLGNNQWDIPKLRELLETILPEKTTFDDYEVEHDFSTIGKRVMLLNARQIKRAFGKEKIILLAIEDITERKSAEESINEKSRITTEYLDILLDHSHAPIIIWDSSLVIKRFNHEFEKLSGYKSAEVIDKKIDILFPEDKIDSTLELLTNRLSGEDLEVIEIDILTKDKDIKTVLWNSANIFDKEGISIVATITLDITKRKQIEETIRISEQQYRHLFENSPIGKTQTRIDGSLHVNKAFSDLLGYSIDELKKLKWQDITYPNDIKESSESFDKLLNGKSKFVRFTKRYIHKNGTTIWADITITLQKDEEGKPLFFNTTIIDITELKHVEAELSESEKHYQMLFNEMDEGFCIIEMIFDKNGKSIDYRFLETNPAFDKQTGLINAQGRSMRELAPEHEEYWFETYGKVALTGKSIRFSNRAEQLHRFYDTYAFRLGPPENRQVAILFNDISERKQAEAKLRESEFRFKQVSENAKELIWDVDKNGLYIYVSPVIKDLLGYEPEEIVGKKHFYDLFDQENREELKQEALEVFAQKLSFKDFVNNNQHKDGRKIILSTSAIPLLDGNGNLIGYRGLDNDITERIQAEKILLKLSSAVEQTVDSIIITDRDGTIEYVNRAFELLTGYSSEEALGKTPRILKSAIQDQKSYEDMWRTILSGKVFKAEFVNKKRNGDLYDEEKTISPIFDKNKNITHFVGIGVDITKRKLAGLELIEAKNKAEESDRLKSAFLTNMSHEIRTPLNGILGFTGLLKEPKLSGVEQQEYIKIIEKSGERMLNIISDIISISIVESGNLKTSIAATDMNKQIEFLLTFFKPEAMRKELDIYCTKLLSPSESVILTDKEKVNSILSNLIKNAIKFTKTGSIEFGCEKKGQYLEYYVKDTGIGINQEKMEIIFDRFRQGSESHTRNYEGAGLGLSISKAYVEVLGGKIWVESEEGKGSTFYFTIPYQAAPEEKIVKKNAVSAYEPVNQPRKLKILIAEDDETSELLIRIVVRIFSDDILEAATGIEAIEVCRNNPDIDLVLMDVKMPDMDGLEATSQIRQFNKEVIIIAQTAYGLAGDKKIALEAGCNEYISKPIDITVLKWLIQKYFYKKEGD